MKWGERANYLISRVVVHGRRRAAEMREVAVTLDEAGLTPRMASATAQLQDWVADLVRDGVVTYPSDRDFAWRALADAVARDFQADYPDTPARRARNR